MKAAEIPNHFSITMEPKEFDELLLALRIYVRDYEASEVITGMLAELEAVGQDREVGGRTDWTPPGWDEPDAEEPGGSTLVPA